MPDNFPAYALKVDIWLSRKSMAKFRRSWAIWQYGTVPQANFQPLAWVTYARYDPAVKDKQSLHDM